MAPANVKPCYWLLNGGCSCVGEERAEREGMSSRMSAKRPSSLINSAGLSLRRQPSGAASWSSSQVRWWGLALSPRLWNSHCKLSVIMGHLPDHPPAPPLPLPIMLCWYRCGIFGVNALILFFLFYFLRCAKSSQIKTVCSSNIFFKGSRFRYRWGRMCACLVLDSVCLQHLLNIYRERDSTWPPLFTHSASCQSYY